MIGLIEALELRLACFFRSRSVILIARLQRQEEEESVEGAEPNASALCWGQTLGGRRTAGHGIRIPFCLFPQLLRAAGGARGAWV